VLHTRGFGHPEVEAAFTRAAELSERSNDARGLFVSLRGKGQYHSISGAVKTACGDVPRVLDLAERMGDHDCLIEGASSWLEYALLRRRIPRRAAARARGHGGYQRERDHYLTYTYSGHDPGVCCRVFGAILLGQLGWSERAHALCGEGLALVEALAHPFTVAIALWNFAHLHQLLREHNVVGTVGERIIRYANEMGLRSMVPVGNFFVVTR
jgi:hypothetical protein